MEGDLLSDSRDHEGRRLPAEELRCDGCEDAPRTDHAAPCVPIEGSHEPPPGVRTWYAVSLLWFPSVSRVGVGMMKPLVALALLAPSAAWQFSAEDPSTTYNFLAHGDWGDDSEGQKACAAGMGAVAAEIGATQVISLGDLFYGSGIHTPADGPDGMLRFDKTFEKVYDAPSLKKIPFYAIAGNHDHGGNVSAEIAYTENAQNLPLTGTNKWTGEPLPRTRWTFPDYWHNVTQQFEVQGKRVELEILLFDSVIMVGNTDIYDDAGNQIDELSLSELKGPPDPASHAKQLAWLEDRMKKSTADYLWLGAHYPVWAIGQDGPTGIRATIRPLLERWNANYFNGHQVSCVL